MRCESHVAQLFLRLRVHDQARGRASSGGSTSRSLPERTLPRRNLQVSMLGSSLGSFSKPWICGVAAIQRKSDSLEM
jgi:hypothetical protein